MDGFELCRRIKRIADLPIIVLSAVDASEAKVRALEEYAEDYVTKPFDPDELVARVQRVLRRLPTGRAANASTDGGELEIDLVQRQVRTPAGGTHPHADRGSGPADPHGLRRPHGPHRDPPRAGLVGVRWRGSLLRLGHRSPPAPEDRAGPGQPAIPPHGARRRLPAGVERRAPAGRPAADDGRGGRLSACSCSSLAGGSAARSSSSPCSSTLAPLAGAHRPGTALLIVVALVGLWAASSASLGGRDDAGRCAGSWRPSPSAGSGPPRGRSATSADQCERRLAIALDERNRQIAELAAHVRAAPIEEDAQAVARSTVSSATSVTHDPTWSLVVFRSPDETHLPTGVYTAESTPPGTIEDVHGWAATVDHDEESVPSVSHASGPWGAFVVVEVAAGDVLRASLLAPWEGRDSPSRAERELLSLLGQNSATAIEHALLYERLRSQTEELNRMATIQSDFLRGVTHDLQTPLTCIRALAAELADQPEISTAGRQDLATISHQADRLRRMVAQLLVASRLEVGALQPRQEVLRADTPRGPYLGSIAGRSTVPSQAGWPRAPGSRRSRSPGTGPLGPARQCGEVLAPGLTDRGAHLRVHVRPGRAVLR